jgi:hypothetical protein
MSRHVSYRGVTIDMESLRRENENTAAMGNMKVNAKGDEIKGGKVVRTAAEIARASHGKHTTVISSGLKGAMPQSPVAETKPAKPVARPVKTKEVELPSGDIIIEEEKKDKA